MQGKTYRRPVCEHDHSVPSRCPQCRSARRKVKKAAACKGWETRRGRGQVLVLEHHGDQEYEKRASRWRS